VSAYQEEARIEIDAPADVTLAVLSDARRVLLLAPREYAKVISVDERVLELAFRRGLFSLRDRFTLHIEVEGDNVLLYHIISPKYTIFVRMEVISRGPRKSELLASIRGIGFNFPRFASKIKDFLEKWVATIKISVETAFEAGAVPARRPAEAAPTARETRPRSEAPQQPGGAEARPREAAEKPARAAAPPAPRGGSGASAELPVRVSPEESERLADPLFEAEALVRGQVLNVATIRASGVGDILAHLGNVVRRQGGGELLVHLELPRGKASMLVRDGALVGVLYEYGGERLLGQEALRRMEEGLPGEVTVTLMRLG